MDQQNDKFDHEVPGSLRKEIEAASSEFVARVARTRDNQSRVAAPDRMESQIEDVQESADHCCPFHLKVEFELNCGETQTRPHSLSSRDPLR